MVRIIGEFIGNPPHSPSLCCVRTLCAISSRARNILIKCFFLLFVGFELTTDGDCFLTFVDFFLLFLHLEHVDFTVLDDLREKKL